MEQKVMVLDPDDSRSVYAINSYLNNGWVVKFVSEQRVASGGNGAYTHGKIVYVLETKE